MKQAEQEAEARRLERAQQQHWQVDAGRWSLGASPSKALEMTGFRFADAGDSSGKLAKAKLDAQKAARINFDLSTPTVYIDLAPSKLDGVPWHDAHADALRRRGEHADGDEPVLLSAHFRLNSST